MNLQIQVELISHAFEKLSSLSTIIGFDNFFLSIISGSELL